MERSVNVKEVIETLAQVFLHHGFSKITAEVFRKAKFNKVDVVAPILNLLFEITTRDTTLEYSPSDRFPILLFILSELDYPRLSNFTNTDESNMSSRELLLALGFLLVKLNVLPKFRVEAINYLVKGVVTHTTDRKIRYPQTLKNASLEDELNELIMLRKKIDFAFRGLHSSINMYHSMLKKYKINEDLILKELNENSIKLKFKHVCLVDILLQSNLKLQKKLLGIVQKQETLLKLHLKWLKNEHVFWKWMSTVSQEALVSNNVNNDIGVESTPRDRLFHSLLFIDGLSFRNIYDQYCDACLDNNSLNDLQSFSLKRFLYHTMSESFVLVDGREYKGNNVFVEEVNDLQTKRRLLEEENKLWLAKYLSSNFSNLIQLPFPRR